ncbi:MAG: hypothetical protein EBU88_13785, partial [Acidobacteria bacterium]|nr:hypothetical protein [Acidobacteriota bacterium]
MKVSNRNPRHLLKIGLITAVLAVSICSTRTALMATDDKRIDFRLEVEPLLIRSCRQCHGLE